MSLFLFEGFQVDRESFEGVIPRRPVVFLIAFLENRGREAFFHDFVEREVGFVHMVGVSAVNIDVLLLEIGDFFNKGEKVEVRAVIGFFVEEFSHIVVNPFIVFGRGIVVHILDNIDDSAEASDRGKSVVISEARVERAVSAHRKSRDRVIFGFGGKSEPAHAAVEKLDYGISVVPEIGVYEESVVRLRENESDSGFSAAISALVL